MFFSLFTLIISLEVKTVSAPLTFFVDFNLRYRALSLSLSLHPLNIFIPVSRYLFLNTKHQTSEGAFFLMVTVHSRVTPPPPAFPPVYSTLPLTFPSPDQPATLKKRLYWWTCGNSTVALLFRAQAEISTNKIKKNNNKMRKTNSGKMKVGETCAFPLAHIYSEFTTWSAQKKTPS